MAAAQKNGYAIVDIQDPSEVVQLAAVNQNVYAMKYINPQSAITSRVLQLYKEKTGEDYIPKIASKYHNLLKLAKNFSFN